MMLLGTAFGGGAAGAGAAAAGTAATAGGLGGGFGGILALGLGVFSGLAEMASANAEAAGMEDEAKQEDFNATQELIKGREETARVIKVTNQAVAAASVAGFASGLTGSGSVVQAQKDAIAEGNYQFKMARSDSDIQAGSRRIQARELRTRAADTRQAGVFGLIGKIGGGFMNLARTG